ncbi:MAG TPA: alpha/beta fold hydrolase [Candidatus Sulfomarinibacteraceae bacterium]|nr:alpha/beta fold hydrolase [Candidatus Sulfomarinibacteraceae bacterium]
MQLDLELYREEVAVAPGVSLSLIEVLPQQPHQTLLFVHGFGGNATQWQYQIKAFAERNHVLAPDLRGHGRSSQDAPSFDMPALVGDLHALLEARGVTEPVVLVGHSFGGAIAVDFALQHPERVSRLVLIATAGEFRLIWPYRLAFRLPPPVLRTLQPVVRGFVDAALPALRRMFHQSLKSWRGWDKFEQLQPPTMVIRGERDRVFPQASFAQVSERVPGADDVNVGASAHMVMIERRDAVNRCIERFIEADTAGDQHIRWRAARQRDDGLRAAHSGLLAERPWLFHYESGVPHTLDIPRLSLTRLLDRAARRFPQRPALQYAGRTVRYGQLHSQVARFANGLRALGVDKGTRVMLLLPNVPHFVVAYYGALRLGAIVVTSNPLARREEIVRQAQNSGAELLVTLDGYQEMAREIRSQSRVRHVIYCGLDDYMPLLRRLLYRWRHRKQRLRIPAEGPDERWWRWLRKWPTMFTGDEPSPEDVAVIQYTGGTTARPKGVTLTHGNLMANTVQTRAWLPQARDGAEVVLCVVPFSHVYGMTAAMNVAVSMGASMILLPRFETREVLAHIKRYRPSLFPGVPSMYMAINNYPGVRRFDVQSINACISGAAPLPIEVKEAFEKLTKARLVEGYGLSEAGPVTHANPVFGQDKTGTIGLPLPNTEARIVDLRTGIPLPLPAGQFGELMVRGPQVMQGYWRDEEATRQVLDDDGWLRTGDVARMDEDGYFQIISRRQDMWQVDEATPAFPRDVEEVIYELPEVQEVVVVAIANQPIAFVQLKEGVDVPASTIMAFARRRLPDNQTPRLVIFVKEFPRSFIGKVLRRELVSQHEHEITAGAGSVGAHLRGLEE